MDPIVPPDLEKYAEEHTQEVDPLLDELWEETQRLWHASPLATNALHDLALRTMWASVKSLNPPPAVR